MLVVSFLSAVLCCAHLRTSAFLLRISFKCNANILPVAAAFAFVFAVVAAEVAVVVTVLEIKRITTVRVSHPSIQGELHVTIPPKAL